MRHSDCGTRAVQKQLQASRLGCTLNRQHDIARGLPSHHNIAIVAGTETHLQYRIVHSATLPYVSRIATTGQQHKMSICDRGCHCAKYDIASVFTSHPNTDIVAGRKNTLQYRIGHSATHTTIT